MSDKPRCGWCGRRTDLETPLVAVMNHSCGQCGKSGPGSNSVYVPDTGTFLVTDGVVRGVADAQQGYAGPQVHLVTTEKPWDEPDECPYTHSHTRNWCGYNTCRES